MVQCVVGLIFQGGSIGLFLIPAKGHGNKGHSMCYPVYGMVHIKEPLLLIGKISPTAGFLSCYMYGPLPYVPTPYNHIKNFHFHFQNIKMKMLQKISKHINVHNFV